MSHQPYCKIYTLANVRNLCDYAELKEDRIKDLNLDDTLEDDAARNAEFFFLRFESWLNTAS